MISHLYLWMLLEQNYYNSGVVLCGPKLIELLDILALFLLWFIRNSWSLFTAIKLYLPGYL